MPKRSLIKDLPYIATLSLVGALVLTLTSLGRADGPRVRPSRTMIAVEVKNPPTGFQDLAFGTPMESVLTQLVQKYRLGEGGSEAHPTFYPRDGKSTLKVVRYDNSIEIENFPFDDRAYTVLLHFTASDKFYRYEFHSAPLRADEFDREVRSQADFFGRVFEAKFGVPTERHEPTLLAVRPGQIAYVARWASRSSWIYTAITTEDGEYYAVAAVVNKALEAEDDALRTSDRDHRAKKAASDF